MKGSCSLVEDFTVSLLNFCLYRSSFIDDWILRDGSFLSKILSSLFTSRKSCLFWVQSVVVLKVTVVVLDENNFCVFCLFF